MKNNSGGIILGDPLDIDIKQGISLLYHGRLNTNSLTLDTLDMTIDDVSANPKTKALSEGRASGLSTVHRGSEFLMKKGMSVMPVNVITNVWTPFGISSADSIRYNTGSHVDVDGLSLMAGTSHSTSNGAGELTLGGFIEAGWGNYDTYNDFNRSAAVHGNGDTNYYGLGLLARQDFSNGLYTEASARVGRIKTDFDSQDLRDGSGKSASFDSSSTYYSSHLGLGYLWQANAQSSLDVFAKYLWTRQSSDSVEVLGDPINFEASNSHRLRTGLRWNHAVNDRISPYIGAAYEYEFDGKSKASTHGYAIDAPSLKGSTGIFELGLNMQPTENKALSVNLGVNGYVGKREGVSGQVQVQYKF
jgi:outer membrane autotransporter protein